MPELQAVARAGRSRDARGTLFYDVVRVATACNAKALILENVPNLLRVDNGHALHIIAGALTAAGYYRHVRIQLLNAAAVAPQHRERVFIVGFRSDLRAAADAFRWPTLQAPPRRRCAPRSRTWRRRCRGTASVRRQWALVRATREYQCSSALAAVHWGGYAIRGGESRAALALAVSLHSPAWHAGRGVQPACCRWTVGARRSTRAPTCCARGRRRARRSRPTRRQGPRRPQRQQIVGSAGRAVFPVSPTSWRGLRHVQESAEQDSASTRLTAT